MMEIFRLHGMPRVIISYRDVKFTSAFGKACLLVWILKSCLAQHIVEIPTVDQQIMQYTKEKYKIYFYNKLAEA